MTRQWLLHSLIAILVILILFAFIWPTFYQDNVGLFTLIAISITAIVAIFTLNYSIQESNRRWEKEVTEATFIQCRIYTHEIVSDLLSLVDSGLLDSTTKFRLSKLNHESFKTVYPALHQKYSNMPVEVRVKAIRLLYNYNLFAAGFLDGKLDKDLGKSLIGYQYCSHVDWLAGLIAFYSANKNDSALFSKIIELRNQWGVKRRYYNEE